MKIDFASMTDAELAAIILGASSALHDRLGEKPAIVSRVQPPPLVTVREPPEADKDFALYIKAQLQRRTYITAEERARVADIAAQYPDWITRQGLPTTKSASTWKRTGQFLGVDRARER